VPPLLRPLAGRRPLRRLLQRASGRGGGDLL
jgi:hypothetical protein